MAKEWEKWIDKVCETIVWKSKVYKVVEKLGTRLCRKCWQTSFLGKCVEKFYDFFLEKSGAQIWCKTC